MTATLLDEWLKARVSITAAEWLRQTCAQAAAGDAKAFYLGFGTVARRVGKADLSLSADDLAAADRARPGWDPRGWSLDQAGRARLVLALPADDAKRFVGLLDDLFAAADLAELVALYQALPLLPHPEAHRWRAGEGVRSSMTSVLRAVAHHNPYPGEQLDDGAFNQMVLKCVFVGLPLDPIMGLDKRANAGLAKMLVDYSFERRAAKRPVTPELWRPVGPFATDDRAKAALKTTLEQGTELEKRAAKLALGTGEGDSWPAVAADLGRAGG